jgi:acyl-CoA synthetase (AMP-forming)/AMP-acid ligase II
MLHVPVGRPARPAPEGTLGFAQAGRRLAVLDEDGTELPDDAIGTLAVHRSDPGLMLGYWRQDGTPELPLTGDWFETGDRVSRRPDGAFVYHGRRDDLITAGGFRVAPQEIEAVFHGAPGVEDCAALAISPKPDTTIIALAFPGRRHRGRARGTGAGAAGALQATEGLRPSRRPAPIPERKTRPARAGRVSCERPCHDPARHHLRPDLPVVLYRLDQPRPRDGGASRTIPSRSSGTRSS